MYCSNCGKEIDNQDNNFCKHCGSSLKNNQQNEAEENINEIVKTDFIDNFVGQKKEYNNIELANHRFKMAYVFLYVLLVYKIIVMSFLLFQQGKNIYDVITNDMVIGWMVFILFVFIFSKLKMPIMLSLIALIMISEKIYLIMISNRIGGMNIIIVSFLVIVFIQSFRANKYIIKTDKKLLKSLFIALFLCILVSSFFEINNLRNFNSKEKKINQNNFSEEEILLTFEKKVFNKYYLKLDTKRTTETRNKIANKIAKCSVDIIKTAYPIIANINVEEIENSCFDKVIKEENLELYPWEMNWK